MKKMRIFSLLILVLLLTATFGLTGVAMAQDENEEEAPQIIERAYIRPLYPKVESIAGGTFEFNIEFGYYGPEPKVFDVRFTQPKGWDIYMTPRYEKEKKISSISLKPSLSAGEEFRVVATAPFWPLPDPGEYNIHIEAISETISSEADIVAEVTAKYIMQTIPTNERYNTVAQAGEENIYSIKLQNLSTDVVENVKFSSNSPDGWSVVFEPEKIDVMEAFDEQTVEATIKPPPKTVAGDYVITLQASGAQITAEEMNVRVTVETPTIWGWVGVIIILIVVIGLIFIFMRFSRR